MKHVKFILATALIFFTTLLQAQQKKILIAAASDLKFALDSIVTAFEKSNPGEVDVTYGSSGKLFEQISHGAPFDIFFFRRHQLSQTASGKRNDCIRGLCLWRGTDCDLE